MEAFMKKYYIGCDMEGCAGNCNWDEVDLSKPEIYNPFRDILVEEVNVACKVIGNDSKIVIKDGHWTETNIRVNHIQKNCEIIRGDDGRNLTGLNKEFHAVILIGYHAAGGEVKYPLAHTITDTVVNEIRLNGKRIGETTLAILDASKNNVPTIFVLGDEAAVNEARAIVPSIKYVITKKISETSYICKSPIKVNEEMQIELSNAINNYEKIKSKLLYMPKKFDLEIDYLSYLTAKKMSYYPGAVLKDKTVKFKVNNIEDFFKIINLCI